MSAATLSASQSILKVRYPTGRLPKALYMQFKYASTVTKREDFTGNYRVVALQNENPQGSSALFPTALQSLQQGTYNNFNVPRVEHFGIARIKGQALKAAEGDEGALVDLWKNECDGISRVELMNHEIYGFGNGSGTLGRILTSPAGTPTITLTVPSDAAKFALGMSVQAVSDATFSPTLRAAGNVGKITGIDRVNGTITLASNWDTVIPGIVTNDYLVRAGDYSSAGTPGVIVGMAGWVVGGATPGTLFGLNRNSDPVRLGGQAYAAANVPLEEAVQEMSALAAQQGGMAPKVLWCHVRDFANLKKSLGTKVSYPKTDMKGSGEMAHVGFSGVEIEGDDGPIKLMTSPFIARNQAFLVDMDSFTLDSLGPAPHLQNYDKNDFLRVAGDDAVEARFASYVAHYTNNPISCVNATGFGA